jgi:hypothetical protein
MNNDSNYNDLSDDLQIEAHDIVQDLNDLMPHSGMFANSSEIDTSPIEKKKRALLAKNLQYKTNIIRVEDVSNNNLIVIQNMQEISAEDMSQQVILTP